MSWLLVISQYCIAEGLLETMVEAFGYLRGDELIVELLSDLPSGVFGAMMSVMLISNLPSGVFGAMMSVMLISNLPRCTTFYYYSADYADYFGYLASIGNLVAFLCLRQCLE